MIDPDLLDVLSESAEDLRGLGFNRPSVWAPEVCVMPDGDMYSVEEFPYVVGILDSTAETNIIEKGAQTGLSQALMTIAKFVAVREQRDVAYYLPEVKTAEEFSKKRFSPVIKDSPILRALCTEDTTELKTFGKASIYLKGATDKALKSTPVSRMFLDELDEWKRKHIAMAAHRLRGQKGDTRTWGISTPRHPDMGIDILYQDSTRERFFFPCPHCGEKIKLDFDAETCYDPEGAGNLVVCGRRVGDPESYNSYLKCNLCHCKLDHETKPEWLGLGEWIATNPDVDPKICRGFHVSQLYSPRVKPHQIAQDYIKGLYDEDEMREFYNSTLGLPFSGSKYEISPKAIRVCQNLDPYRLNDADIIPTSADTSFVTLGVDQGGTNPHTWVAVDWKYDGETKLGDINDKAIGRVIGYGELPPDRLDLVAGLMTEYLVQKAVIDNFPSPNEAKKLGRQFKKFLYLCQYAPGIGAKDVRESKEEKVHIVKVNRSEWITNAFSRILNGRIQLPLGLGTDFKEHLYALKMLYNVRPSDGTKVATYENYDKPDHYAHALVYAELALRLLKRFPASRVISRIR